MPLSITVVTVAFGNPDIVRNWVQKWSSTGASCLISDNGNSVPFDLGKEAEILPFNDNSGFGGGINRAVQASGTPIVLITNPDTLPADKESINTLLDFHSVNSFTGAFTLNSKGLEVHSTGIWPHKEWVRSQIFHSAKGLWRPERIDWLQGSLIMVNRDEFLRLGGFSSRYPLYFEDVDICARAKKQGMNINFCRESRFIHDEGTGSDPVTATRLSCFHWGMLEYFRNHDRVSFTDVRRMIIAKCILRLFAYTARDTESAKGYFAALKSVLSDRSPELPGANNDR